MFSDALSCFYVEDRKYLITNDMIISNAYKNFEKVMKPKNRMTENRISEYAENLFYSKLPLKQTDKFANDNTFLQKGKSIYIYIICTIHFCSKNVNRFDNYPKKFLKFNIVYVWKCWISFILI